MKHPKNSTSRSGSRRGSEENMKESKKSHDTTHTASLAMEPAMARTRSDSEPSQPRLTKQKSEDKFSWIRAFKGKRGSESKERFREITIVHTTHDEMPRSVPIPDFIRPGDEEPRAFVRSESIASLRERSIQQTWHDSLGSPRNLPMSFEENAEDVEEDPENLEDEDSDPWHLEERLSAATALAAKMMDMQAQEPKQESVGDKMLSRMSDSTVASEAPSLQSFLGDTELNLDDDTDTDSIVEVEGSPGRSPHTAAQHDSWNWAVPIRQPSALTPAPPPKPVMDTIPSPGIPSPSIPSPGSVELATPTIEVGMATAGVQIGVATAKTMKANMVSMRRPSRPDNPWNWRLPAPDPTAPKINTVMVRRPSQAPNWNLKSVTSSPNLSSLSSSTLVAAPRPKRLTDEDDISPLTQNFPRRPSRQVESGFRQPPTLVHLIRDIRKPSVCPNPNEALSSHPVRVRQDSAPEALCRMCHYGLAEAWGVCQKCEEELTPPALNPKFQTQNATDAWQRLGRKERKGSRPPPIMTRDRNYSCVSVASYSSSISSTVTTPTTSTVNLALPNQPNSPQPTVQSPAQPPAQSIPAVQNIIEESDVDERSPSPTCRAGPLEDFGPPTSSTSLSGVATPDLLAQYQFGTLKPAAPKAPDSPPPPSSSSAAAAAAPEESNPDSWADYYFDSDNFDDAKDRPRTKSAVTREQAQSYMAREVALEEYDGFWGSPVSPGPGWI